MTDKQVRSEAVRSEALDRALEAFGIEGADPLENGELELSSRPQSADDDAVPAGAV